MCHVSVTAMRDCHLASLISSGGVIKCSGFASVLVLPHLKTLLLLLILCVEGYSCSANM